MAPGGSTRLKLLGSNSALSMKLDFGPPIATFRIAFPSIAPVSSSSPRPYGLPFFRYCRGSAPVGAGFAGLWRAFFQSDGPAWRHRTVARRQDRLHYRASSRPDPWRPLSGFRALCHRTDRAGPAGAAARRRGAALRLLSLIHISEP